MIIKIIHKVHKISTNVETCVREANDESVFKISVHIQSHSCMLSFLFVLRSSLSQTLCH